MYESGDGVIEADFLPAPRHSKIRLLHGYWLARRGARLMPARADIDPVDIPALLPHILMYNVDAPGQYTVRLVGEAVQAFVGKNTTGQPAGTCMPDFSAKMMIQILDAVVAERAPKFRAGKAHWRPDKQHRTYEACFLPLSPDGNAINIILGACVVTD